MIVHKQRIIIIDKYSLYNFYKSYLAIPTKAKSLQKKKIRHMQMWMIVKRLRDRVRNKFHLRQLRARKYFKKTIQLSAESWKFARQKRCFILITLLIHLPKFRWVERGWIRHLSLTSSCPMDRVQSVFGHKVSSIDYFDHMSIASVKS